MLDLIPWPYKLIAVMILMAASFYGGSTVQGWKDDKTIADINRKNDATLNDINVASFTAQEEAHRKILEQQTQIAKIDHERYTEKENARLENEKLRADLAAGNVRLHVRAVCPSPNAVPASTIGASVDHAETTAELDGAVAAGLVGLTGEGDDSIRQLTACQAILNVVTGGKFEE